jgi:hypothetical protein
VQDVLDGLGSETLHAVEEPVVDGIGELLDAGDVQVAVQRHRFLRAEGRDRDELADAGRDL